MNQPPEFELTFRCTRDHTQWTEYARVVRDGECPCCGVVHLPVETRQLRDWSA